MTTSPYATDEISYVARSQPHGDCHGSAVGGGIERVEGHHSGANLSRPSGKAGDWY